MLSVILLILKIIGITIAVILGVALALILLILFIPLRYKLKVKQREETDLTGRVSWLLGVIHFKIKFIGKKMTYTLRILGYPVFSNDPSRKRRKKRKPKKRKPKKKARKRVDKPVVVEKSKNKTLEKKPAVVEETKEIETKQSKTEKAEVIKTKDIKVKEYAKQEGPKQEKKKESFIDKVKRFFAKFKNIGQTYRRIKQKIRDMLTLIKRSFKKIGLVKAFLTERKHKPGFNLLWKSIRKILRHSKPLKIKADLHFGFEDPAQTGQVLGLICAVYPRILGKVDLRPDFEHKVFEGDLYARGRVRVITVLVIVIKLIINKDFKYVIKDAKQLKEEL